MFVDIFKTDKKYNIIYADPPWSYRNMGNIQATASSHYKTMTQESIENLGGGSAEHSGQKLYALFVGYLPEIARRFRHNEEVGI